LATEPAETPNILVFPPALIIAAMLLVVALEWLAPIRLLPPPGRPWMVAGGAALLALAAWLGIAGNLAFRRAKTNVNPRRPALVLVENGPFRWTRNPMYLSMVTVLLGLALAFSLDWGLIAAPVVWAVLNFGVVLREEAYLKARFGAAYGAYLARTRRWL
jgi:protein-S-isoprenylcysteine O-methyltransferase Ste14